MTDQLIKKITRSGVLEKAHVSGLFKNVQMQGAQSRRNAAYFRRTPQRRELKRNAT